VLARHHKENYRIGVVTHWSSQSNYGQILQAYALQKYLMELGHDAYIVKYLQKNKWGIKKCFNVFKLESWKNRLWRFIKRYNEKKRPRYFNEFKNKHLKFSNLAYYTFAELMHNPPDADMFIVGSDQVWGPWYSLEPYFLSFCEKSIKKIAYSASFGGVALSLDEIADYSKRLKDFFAVSVREQSAVKLCKQLGYGDAKWVPDPTLLLDKDDWLKLSHSSSYYKTGDTKILVYIIGHDDHTNIYKTADYLGRDSNPVYVSDDNDIKANAFPAIEEWLDLVFNADFVVTNSFHGTVFSLLFNKKFVTIAREGNESVMNTRFKSLLNKVELSDRFIDIYNPNYIDRIINKTINWSHVNEILDVWRREGVDFLYMAINGNP